jgi:hypothetical protein
MEADIPSCPIHIRPLAAETVVFVPDATTQLIEQFWLSFRYCFRPALFAVYLTLYKHAVLAEKLGPVRFTGDQTNLHNGAPLCITDRLSLLNKQLNVWCVYGH